MDNFNFTSEQREEINKYFYQCGHVIGWSTLPDYFSPRPDIDEKGKKFIEVRDRYLQEGRYATGEDAYKLSQGSKDKNLGMVIWQVKPEFVKEKQYG